MISLLKAVNVSQTPSLVWYFYELCVELDLSNEAKYYN